MIFNQNKLILFFTLVLVQVLFTYSSPITENNYNVEEELNNTNLLKRTYEPPYNYTLFHVYFKKPDNWGDKIYAYIYDTKKDSEGLNKWPGLEMNTCNHDYCKENPYDYYVILHRSYFNENSRIIFTDGKNHQSPEAFQEGFKLLRFGLYTQDGIKGFCKTADDCSNTYAIIYYISHPDWYGHVYAHYQIGNNNSWTEKPEFMFFENYREDFGSNESYLFVDVKNEKELTVAFCDLIESNWDYQYKARWDNNHGKNFKVYPLTENILHYTV
ncbi:hypothetical protein BCR32DRAFT_269268 [Anaeromyces robustus]|uniref:Starch-binding module 26 domain-containing protein n=1 Tax=Anaeromyces robustus TaxID=1754192 RepID=A0A1Y1X1R4_9FUNG|nr:hypothetical protein BCR32DRAFT_269268 [Anaeromyces robustus]|eukprot:ORX79739.1 hypothetical protein BCR32DRAFT_269268 [Anaeromyces robustus]